MDFRRQGDLLRQRIEEQARVFEEASQWLFEHPEVGGEEREACALWSRVLEERGFRLERNYGGLETAFCAFAGAAEGPTVAFLTEYDALPEVGHGCGHNWSGAASALAGVALVSLLPELPGRIRVVGTPAEETFGGKIPMAQQGLFDDVDLAVMIHAESAVTKVAVKCMAMDAVEFRFKGQPAHASECPWEGRNALNGVLLLFHALDMLRQHTRPEVRTHGIVEHGGVVPNIVPEGATARFYFRAPRRPELDALLEKVWNCARGAALATDTEVTWEFYEGSMDDMVPNPTLAGQMTELLEELGYPCTEPREATGSSDVGNVSYRCPTLQPELAVVPERLVIHTREFAQAMVTPRAREALRHAAYAMAFCGLRVLGDEGFRRKVREDFETERKRGREGR